MVMLQEKETKKSVIKKIEHRVWNKPVIITITKDELQRHIKVAARSVSCPSNVR